MRKIVLKCSTQTFFGIKKVIPKCRSRYNSQDTSIILRSNQPTFRKHLSKKEKNFQNFKNKILFIKIYSKKQIPTSDNIHLSNSANSLPHDDGDGDGDDGESSSGWGLNSEASLFQTWKQFTLDLKKMRTCDANLRWMCNMSILHSMNIHRMWLDEKSIQWNVSPYLFYYWAKGSVTKFWGDKFSYWTIRRNCSFFDGYLQ